MKTWAQTILLLAAMPAGVIADSGTDFETAHKSWQAANIRSYEFTVTWEGAVLFPPHCAGARIRVRVREGSQASSVVVRGSHACPRGTRGKRIVELDLPLTIEDAFERVMLHIAHPTTSEQVTVTYDATYGFPSSFYAAQLQMADSEEGFRISNFSVLN